MDASLAAPVRRRRPWFARQDWYFAIALACFTGTAVWYGRAIQEFLSPSAQTIATPSLVGQTVSDAFASAARDKLKATVVERQSSDKYPKDVVMRQEPPAGAQVRQGRQISLVVSNGVQIFPMPDLRYESLREVGLDLSHEKLVLGKVKTVPSDEVPANRVVTQDPAPLSAVREGSVVNIELAKGGPPAQKAPNFVGMSVDEARAAAADAHIHLGQLVWTPFGSYGPPRGVVVRQRPDSGSLLDSNDVVSLQVSAGPREAGYLVRQVHATVTVPENLQDPGKAQSVRIEVRDETGTWNVYNAYAQVKQKLDFNLTVVGTAELDTYVNNELLDSAKIGVEPPQVQKPKSDEKGRKP